MTKWDKANGFQSFRTLVELNFTEFHNFVALFLYFFGSNVTAVCRILVSKKKTVIVNLHNLYV